MARNTNGEGFSLKDELFNRTKVQWLANQLAVTNDSFDASTFERSVMKKLLTLELKERIEHITDCLEEQLDSDFAVAAKQIKRALPPKLDPKKTDDDFGDFIMAPFGAYVARHGCERKHLKRSLSLLRELTMRFSVEFYIRFFIDQFPKETMEQLAQWSTDKNYHVRRLVSEGTRPLLPWAGRLTGIAIADPLPLLTLLHADSTRYVTRSVANHLNDIAKREPALVIKTLKTWRKVGKQESAELAWMTKHALRTLIKQGDSQALALLGYQDQPQITISDFTLDQQQVAVGESQTFSFTITAQAAEQLMIDYVVDFVKKNGQTTQKVFKIAQAELVKGESQLFKKRHPFKANSTTFTYYSGTHRFTLQINGQQFDSGTFLLVT